jgi:TonB family protein
MNGRNVIDTRGPGGWGNEVAQRLIRRAAHNAPPPLAERLQEEWLADLATRHGQLARVLFGLGCCWATTVIAQEHRALNVSAAASTVTGSAAMTTQVQLPFLPRRATVLVTIVGLHVAIIYVFATGLAHRLIEPPQGPMIFDLLRETRTAPTPPPLPSVNLSHPKIESAEPVISVDVDRSNTIRDVVPPLAQPLPPQRTTVRPPVKRVSGGPGKDFPNSDDYYPPAARRLGEQGNTAIQVCVDASGKLTAAPQVTHSSGSSRLDEGALRLARAGSGHYRASTENGTPVSSCYDYLIRFNLQ